MWLRQVFQHAFGIAFQQGVLEHIEVTKCIMLVLTTNNAAQCLAKVLLGLDMAQITTHAKPR
ncbi:hypothetical protein KP05_08800 [Cobetia amphilecti]|nr:hypothetical protein KP05_08800 [Cobetia amphilecti]